MIVIPIGFAQVTLDFQIPAPGGSKVASTTFGVSNNPGPTLISAICDVYNDTVWQVVGTVRGRMIGGTIRDSVSTYEHVMDEPGTVAIALPPGQILAQIDHLERQRRDLDKAIAQLRSTHAQLAGDEMRASHVG